MTKTIIIGKSSNLSQRLSKCLRKSVLISSRDIASGLEAIKPYISKPVNIVFNNFQPAVQLSNLDAPADYINNAIFTTAKLLGALKHAMVNKVIYTSSSSVYGDNDSCKESDQVMPSNLHAALKFANEQLVGQFCQKNAIDYTVTRVFNMYGGDDKFSIVSKVLKAFKQAQALNIFNNGAAIRDFIHIDDVVTAYSRVLETKNVNILNIGTGQGIAIKALLDIASYHDQDFKINNVTRKEIDKSVSDNTLFRKIIGEIKYLNIRDFLSKELVA